MNIGERLKNLRESRELTLEQVGNYLGVNKATVQRYESGNIDIKRNVAIKLAEVLRTTPAFIMGWEDEAELEQVTCSAREKKVLLAYRNNREMQAAVDRVLGIAPEEEKVRVFRAARSDDNAEGGYIDMSRSKLDKLREAPEADEE